MIELLKTKRVINPYSIPEPGDDYKPEYMDSAPDRIELMNKINEIIIKLNSIS